MIATSPNQIELFRLATLRAGLKLEAIGMRKKGPSCLSVLRKDYGIKARTAKAALVELNERAEKREKNEFEISFCETNLRYLEGEPENEKRNLLIEKMKSRILELKAL